MASVYKLITQRQLNFFYKFPFPSHTTMKLSQALDNNHIVSSRKSMMARPQGQKRLWTPEEDDKLIEFKRNYPDRPWPGTAQLAGLDRTDKSCWERWNNHLKPGVNKENFSEEEDDIIISNQRNPEHRNKWAFMEKNHLPGRTANAIKNRWNNHLKKMVAIIDDLERYLLMDDETSDHSDLEDDVKSLMAEYASLIY